MGSLVVSTASGIGSSPFGMAVGWAEIYAQIVTPGPSVELISFATVPKVYHGGWYGTGYAASGGFPAYITWGKYMEYAAEDYGGPTGIVAYGDTLFWDLSLGTTVYLEVDW